MTLSRRALLARMSAAYGYAGFWHSLPSAPTEYGDTPLIATSYGKLRGRRLQQVCAYRGIPYAASTAGAGRFKPPAPPSGWSGIRELEDCGPPCPQVNRDLRAWVDLRPASEDCLYLNVWTPADAAGRHLPVMVWIHGGAYVSGSGGLAIYDGAALARTGEVVVVTVNHRLSALGYLYVGALDGAYLESGNVGQLDLIAALEWVRDNIAGFGGDAGNVTVFGESGGGGKITALCAMPQARKLFHKAIVQSGSLWRLNTLQEAADTTEATLRELGLNAGAYRRLFDLPAEQLVQAGDRASIHQRRALSFRPVIDRHAILEQSWDPRAPAAVNDVPMLIGSNRDEAAYFLEDPVSEPTSDEDLVARLLKADISGRMTSEKARALLEAYRRITPHASRLELTIAIGTDSVLWRDAVIQAERKTAQRAPVFVYQFSWRTPCFGRQWCPHGSEIPLVFGNLDYLEAWDRADTPAARTQADPTNTRYALSMTMLQAWTQFARKGDPSTPALPWQSYEPARRMTMTLDRVCELQSDPHGTQRKLLDSVLGSA